MSWAKRLSHALARMREHRRQVVGINRRNVALVYRHNRRTDYPLADDKLLAKQQLAAAGVPVPQTLSVAEGLSSIPTALEAVAERGDFVVKPANGSGGDGILVVGELLAPGRWRRAGGAEVDTAGLTRHLASAVFGTFSKQLEDRAFLEERVTPDAFFSTLWADGLCDLRVITLKGAPVLSMVRVPTAESEGRANLHQGGVGIAIDLATGRTTAALHKGKRVDRHPDSGQPLLGLEVPRWRELVEVARRSAGAVPLGYLGVDLVLDAARGPLVLEINVRPGLEIQNVHGRGLALALEEAQA